MRGAPRLPGLGAASWLLGVAQSSSAGKQAGVCCPTLSAGGGVYGGWWKGALYGDLSEITWDGGCSIVAGDVALVERLCQFLLCPSFFYHDSCPSEGHGHALPKECVECSCFAIPALYTLRLAPASFSTHLRLKSCFGFRPLSRLPRARAGGGQACLSTSSPRSCAPQHQRRQGCARGS